MKHASLSFILLSTFIVFAFSLVSVPAFAANEKWPKGDWNCINKGKGFEKDCTVTYKYLAIDPQTGADKIYYLNRGTQFKKSQIKKAYAKQGLEASKADLSKDAKFEGLRDANGDVLLETIYDKVAIVSATHSVVRLKDGKTLKIAEHRSHKLMGLPAGYPVAGWQTVFDPKSELNRHVVWTINYADRKNPRAPGGMLQPDLTLSPMLKNINSRISIPVAFGKNFAIPVYHPKTGKKTNMLFDMRGKLLNDNFQFYIKKVTALTHRVGSKVPSHKVMHVGEAPRSTRLEDRRLYWPIDKNGILLPRPANIMGVLPIYSKERKVNTGWLTVIKSTDGYDYTFGSLDKDSRPDKIAANLDKLLLLDEIEFYTDSETIYKGEKFGAGDSIVVKLPRKNGQPSLWHEPHFIPQVIKPNYDFEKNNFGDIPYPKGSTTAQGARIALKNHFIVNRRKHAKEKEEKAAFEKEAAKHAWSNPTRYARECMAEYTNIKRIQVEGWRGKNTDADLRWAQQYEYNKNKPCDEWPSNRGKTPPATAGAPAYTFQKGLEDIARAAACTYQSYECTNIGNGQQSCTWVTRKTC